MEEGAVARINRILERAVISRLQRVFCCFSYAKLIFYFEINKKYC